MKFEAKTAFPPLLALIASTVALLLPCLRRTWLTRFFLMGAYYVLLLTVGCWIYHGIRFFRSDAFTPPPTWQVRTALLIALVGVLATFISVPVEFKTLSDETNLLSVSQSMFREKTVKNVIMNRIVDGRPSPFQFQVPKRPLLFPWLTHALHAVMGYRPINPFILNGLILLALLALVHLAVCHIFDAWTAAAAVVLVLSQPVIGLYATSAGFDLLTHVFFLFLAINLWLYLRQPRPAGFGWLWMCLVVFTYARYESMVFLPLIMLLLKGLGKLPPKVWRPHLSLIAWTPLLLSAAIWQRALTWDRHELPPGAVLYSLRNFATNGWDFIKTTLLFSSAPPFAAALNLAAWIVLICWIVQWKKRGQRPLDDRARYIVLIAVCLLVHGALYLGHYFGRISHPANARYFIFYALWMSLILVTVKALRPRTASPWLLGAAVGLLLQYHPQASRATFTRSLLEVRKTRFAHAFLAKQDKTVPIMVLVNRPGQYTVLEHGALDFKAAKGLHALLFNDVVRKRCRVLAIQDLQWNDVTPKPGQELDPGWSMRVLTEITTSPASRLRIVELSVGSEE